MSLLLDVSRHLISADTVSDRGTAGVMGWLADWLEARGLSVTLQRWGEGERAKANLVARAGPLEPEGLVLSGHLDVVPFAKQPGWTRDALTLEVGDTRVYGRGTSDMKVFLAQCLTALDELDLSVLSRPVVLLFTSDEEVGCLGAARLAPALAELLDCPLPRLAWIGEPTSGRIYHAHKGIVAFPIEVRGEGGHSSIPDAGVSAIAVAARALARIGSLQEALRRKPREAFRALYPQAPYTTLNFGTISGGTAANMIPETCRFEVSYRPLPDEDPLALYAAIQEALADPPADWGSDRAARLSVGPALVAPGMQTPLGTPLEEALGASQGAGAAGGAPYCTDGGQLARAGIEALICGPGELEQAHQPDESLPRSAFEHGAGEILRVVRQLCAAG